MLVDAAVLAAILLELIRHVVKTGRTGNDVKNGIHIDGKAISWSASPANGERAINRLCGFGCGKITTSGTQLYSP